MPLVSRFGPQWRDMRPGEGTTDAPSYPPLDPESEEGRVRKAFHDLGRTMEQARTTWHSLSEWVAGEHTRHIEGRAWQRSFEPRRISPPGGYHSPKEVAASMTAFFSNVCMEQKLGVPMLQTQVTAHAILYEIIRHKVPVYYVADAFIRAVAATDLPRDFTLHDLHWPMPGMVLGFPVKFVQEYLGCDVCYVFCADLAEGDHQPPPELEAVPFVGQHWTVQTPDKVALMFSAWSNDGLGSWVSAYRKADRVDEAITKYAYTDYTFADAKRVEADQQATQKVATLVFKLLVVLNTRPALVEPGGIERSEKRHAKTGEITRSELWRANMIGATYRVLRQPGTGAHASPRTHWRRGHLTHQRIGSTKAPDFIAVASLPRREDGEIDWLAVSDETRRAFWRCHKRTWIEPMLVNFDHSLSPPPDLNCLDCW